MRTPRKPVLPALAATAVASAAALIQAAPVHAEVTSLGGGAYGESLRVSSAVSVSSGPRPSVTLPSSGGGPYSSTVASASSPGLLATGVIVVTTRGDRVVSHLRTATSSATVNNANIGAGVVRATTVKSECTANGTGSKGSTILSGNNLGVSSSPAPNTVRRLPGVGSVTLNEQIRSNVPGVTTSITVNAIHVRLDGGTLGSGDIVIGQSRCQANGPDVLKAAPATGGSGSSAGTVGAGTGSAGTVGAGTGSAGTVGAGTGSAGTGGSAGTVGTGSTAGGVGAAQPATPLPGTARFTG